MSRSRKGYLLTRWQLGGGGGAVLDLVNVHNFHDESNLAALAAGPARPRPGGGRRVGRLSQGPLCDC